MVVSGGSSAAGVRATEAAADWEASSGSPVSSGAVGRRGRSSAGLLLFVSDAEGFDDAAALNGRSRTEAIDQHL